jgi:hypothetical protein
MPMALAGIAKWIGCVPLMVVTAQAIGPAQQPPPVPPTAPTGGRMMFTEPAPLDFNDHTGYVSLFDGVSRGVRGHG